MVAVYDSWERLVRATLRREQLRLIAERTPSDRSLASSSSFNFNLHSSRLSPRKFPSLLFGMKFGYDEILRAANYFSESKLIKRGRSGDLFRGVIRGTLVVIKRIDWSSAEKESYCISELKVLAKLPDSGLVPLLGYCLDNWNEKYLVYVCLPSRDLSSSFYSKFVWLEHVYPPWWNWRNRLRIAIGLAEVLSVLHHQCVPPLVHRDIQASSILLHDDFKVRLCSLGDVCTEERESKGSTINRFLGLPQDFSQRPSGTANATRAYDVYCFGKVLLDLGTGKLAAADSTIMEDLMNKNPHKSQEEEDHVARMIDPIVIMDMPELKDEVQTMVTIAKACLNPEPSERPSIANVLMALKDLSGVVPADPSCLNGAALRKTIPKRSKISRLVLGTWLRS